MPPSYFGFAVATFIALAVICCLSSLCGYLARHPGAEGGQGGVGAKGNRFHLWDRGAFFMLGFIAGFMYLLFSLPDPPGQSGKTSRDKVLQRRGK